MLEIIPYSNLSHTHQAKTPANLEMAQWQILKVAAAFKLDSKIQVLDHAETL
jgi:hypothetical protein